MKKSHDHTHLTRLAAISLCLVMCLSALPMLAPSASALYAADGVWRGNATNQTGWLDILDYDVERDQIGSTLVHDHRARPEVNHTFEAMYYPNTSNKVLNVQIDGDTTAWEGRIYLGRPITGRVKLSFDVMVHTTGSSTNSVIIQPWNVRTGTSYASLQVSAASNGTPYLRVGTPYNYIATDEWHTVSVVLDFDERTSTRYIDDVLIHSESLAAGEYFDAIQIKTFEVTNGAAATIGCYIDNIRVSIPMHAVQALPSDVPTPSISIIFDDGLTNTREVAAPILGDLPGAVALNTNYVGEGKRMSWEQASELHTMGWEIMSHGADHVDLTTLSETALRYQFASSREAIREHLGIDVRGMIYPFNAHNAFTDRIGWEYYEYLGTSSQDMRRNAIYSTSADDREYLDRHKASIIYSQYVHLNYYTHAVNDAGAATDTNTTAFAEWVQWLKDNNVRVVTPSEGYIPYRAAAMAVIEGTPESFSVSYPDGVHNYAAGEVLISIDGEYTDEQYVAVDASGAAASYAMPQEGRLVMSLGPGTYEIMTVTDFRRAQMDNAISPLYTVIPALIVLAVLGSLITMVGRIKF